MTINMHSNHVNMINFGPLSFFSLLCFSLLLTCTSPVEETLNRGPVCRGTHSLVCVKDPRPTPSWVLFWSKFPTPGFPSPSSITFSGLYIAPFSYLY